jgi:hypothetical protein
MAVISAAPMASTLWSTPAGTHSARERGSTQVRSSTAMAIALRSAMLSWW